jgi:hypothetical protein
MGTMLHLRTINQTTEPRSQTSFIWQVKVETAGKVSSGCGRGGTEGESPARNESSRHTRKLLGGAPGSRGWRSLARTTCPCTPGWRSSAASTHRTRERRRTRGCLRANTHTNTHERSSRLTTKIELVEVRELTE